MSNVTPWFRIGAENPSPERPGHYEVWLYGMGMPPMFAEWTGQTWLRIGRGLQPSVFYGDLWRGLQEPAE